MSQKQLKKLILIIVSSIVVVAGIFSFGFFFLNSDNSSTNIDTIKEKGGYENLKVDLVSELKVREGQAATVADIFFEDLGVLEYSGLTRGGLRGNTTLICDGYEVDALIKAGVFYNAYIGNVVVYKNPKESSHIIPNASEYSYKQYGTMVASFTKDTGLDEQAGKDIYKKMTSLNISNLTNIKKGKLNNIQGFYGEEGNLKYFFTLKSDDFGKISVVCDGFDPITVYDSSVSVSESSVSDVKLLYGTRQGVANIIPFKIKNLIGSEVIFPAALLNGEDSWLMVKNDGVIYIEVRGEVKEKEKTKTKDFVIKLTDEGRDIIYLKIDRKVYVE